VVQSVSARREWKVPASIMGHGRRIIKGIDISADRPLLGNMAEDPFLLKPRDVSDFPEQWVNDTQTGTKKLVIGKIRNELKRPFASILHPYRKFGVRDGLLHALAHWQEG